MEARRAPAVAPLMMTISSNCKLLHLGASPLCWRGLGWVIGVDVTLAYVPAALGRDLLACLLFFAFRYLCVRAPDEPPAPPLLSSLERDIFRCRIRTARQGWGK